MPKSPLAPPSTAPADPTAGRRRYHHGDLRHALVGAALELIAEEDPARLSLRRVARRAGVSNAAPYHHFTDKNHLLAEVARQGFLELNQGLETAAAGLDEPFAILAARARAYLRFARGHPAHYRVMFLPELSDREAFADMHETAEISLAALLALVQGVMGRPAGDASVMSAAMAAWSTLHGFATLWNEGLLANKPGAPSVEPMAEAAVAAVVAGIRAAGEPTPAARSEGEGET